MAHKGKTNTVLNLRLRNIPGDTRLRVLTDGKALSFELDQKAKNIEHTTPLTADEARIMIELERLLTKR